MTSGGKVCTVMKDNEPTLSFLNNKLRGSTGCNLIDGSYSANADGSIRLEEYGVTEMACLEPGAMNQESDFINVISQVTRFSVNNGVLVLDDGTTQNQLQFIPQQSIALPLVSTSWTLTHFTESDGTTDSAASLVAGSTITLLMEGTKVSGSGGVDRYQGQTEIAEEENKLRITLAEFAAKDDSDELLKQESHYLDVLSQMTRYSLNKNTLVLSNDDQTLGLQFECTDK